jgi:hypothetical protein
VYLAEMGEYDKTNQDSANALQVRIPPRMTLAVVGLPLGTLDEMEMIAQGSSSNSATEDRPQWSHKKL